MSERHYHLTETPIPEGLQIFEERLEVAGIGYQRDDARAFAAGRGLTLELERKPDNLRDKNAIRIMGRRKTLFGSKRHFIGYAPSAVAAKIIEGNYYASVVPRLLKTYIGDSGYVEILFQILGPKGQRLKYNKADPESLPVAALGREADYPAFVDQVEYLKQEKRYDEAIALLLKLVAETEKEAMRNNCGVAPWYYEQLAIVYRKIKRLDDEIQILERYESQPKAPGVSPEKLAERLKKARENLEKHPT
jgi:tetratricopeptide (TPR) repeat protein